MGRKELEELWRSRVTAAKVRFMSARKRTNDVVRDYPLENTSPDGLYAYQQAIRQENLALAEYNRVRRIYADLVSCGIVPDESESPPALGRW